MTEQNTKKFLIRSWSARLHRESVSLSSSLSFTVGPYPVLPVLLDDFEQ